MARIMVVIGTRPEAIKLFPVVQALNRRPKLEVQVCVTAQHRELLDPVLALAEMRADVDLNLMLQDQSLDALTARLLTGLGETFTALRPDRVVVQGDTATAMTGALAASFRQIPVAHVEAGLRSGNIAHPWPEEINRRIIAPMADIHFAPTRRAAQALLDEQISSEAVHVTGNTVVDALHWTRLRIAGDPGLYASVEPLLRRFRGKRLILVTSHRRENFGAGIESIAAALRKIAARPDVALVLPVHPNPNVSGHLSEALTGIENLALLDALDYPSFVSLLSAAELVLTDSGGVQEEAPVLGKPVLVMRETTERPEGVEAGGARLVGTDIDRICAAVFSLLDDKAAYGRMARAQNPYGDGRAGERIAELIANAHA